MARLLLDSTVIIDALRGRPAADRLVGLRRRGIEPWVCSISVDEIWRGLRHGEEAADGRFFGAVRIAPIGVREDEVCGVARVQAGLVGVRVAAINRSNARDRGRRPA